MKEITHSLTNLAALALVFLSLTHCGKKEVAHECGSETAGAIPYNYCIDRPAANASGDIMFYFHGLNADETEFSKAYGTSVLNELANRGAAPTVISISFGPLWFLTDADNANHPALHELVVNTIIPQMEQKITTPLRHRVLMGESMGGFNAIQLLVKNAALFTDAVLLCPAISTLSPTSTDDQLAQYAASHDGVVLSQLYLARKLAQSEFPTQADWDTHNPLELALSLSSTSPPFFISGGTKDEWGFYEGQNEFANIAKSLGAPVEWTSIPDKGHCIQTADSLSALLTF